MPAAVAAAIALAAAIVALRWALRRAFRVPRLPPRSHPADHGLDATTIRIPGANGKALSAWMIPAPTAGPAPAVVAMHGWGAERSSLLPLVPPLHRAGFALVLVDARNHGGSDGDSFSSMPRFAEDIEATLDWLRRRADVDHARVSVLGHSVGGAAALLAASRRPEVAAVVSLSAFDHPEQVMRRYLGRLHLPYRPFGWLVCRYVERVIGHRFDAIAPINTVAAVRCPVLIGHGADDTMVPVAAARAIHARAAAGQLHVLADSGHEDCADIDNLGRIVSRFLTDANQPSRLGR